MNRVTAADPDIHVTTSWPRPKPIPSRRDGWRYHRRGRINLNDPLVLVFDSALREAHEHSLTDLSREVGGLLVGGYYIDPQYERPLHYVEIEGFVPARQGESATGSFTFTHDSWPPMRRAMEERFGDDRIFVGWHHTHPGMSVFLSGKDKFIHQHFFPETWRVALVVDPKARDSEFFRMRGNTDEKCGFFLLSREDDRNDSGAMEDVDLRILS